MKRFIGATLLVFGASMAGAPAPARAACTNDYWACVEQQVGLGIGLKAALRWCVPGYYLCLARRV